MHAKAAFFGCSLSLTGCVGLLPDSSLHIAAALWSWSYSGKARCIVAEHCLVNEHSYGLLH